MVRKLSLIIFTLFVFQFACAQEGTLSTEKELRLGVGYGHLRMLDRQVSPLIYQANMLPIEVGFAVEKKHRLELDFGLSLGGNRSRNFAERLVIRRAPDNEGNLKDSLIQLGNVPIIQQAFNFHYYWKVPTASKDLTLLAGFGLREFFSISFSPTAIFVINEVSLNPAVQARYQLSDDVRISASLSVPLTGIMVRLPYANDPADGKHGNFGAVYSMGTRLFSPLNYQKVNFQLSYSRPLGERWRFEAGYKFYWLKYHENRGVTAYQNNLQFTFSKSMGSR